MLQWQQQSAPGRTAKLTLVCDMSCVLAAAPVRPGTLAAWHGFVQHISIGWFERRCGPVLQACCRKTQC